MRRTLSISCAAFLLSIAPLCLAIAEESDPAKTSPVDPTGTWRWERTFNDNTAEFELKLNWDGKQLTGKYSAFDNTSDIEQTKLEKDQMSFLAKREINGNQFEVKFDGQVKPDELAGKINVDFGDGPQEFDWVAKRAVVPEDVLGTWNLQIETPNGLIEPRLTITKEGDELHGAYVSPFGEREAKNVAVKDNTLTWEISGERDGANFKIVYTGKPRGNSIEGTNEFDFDGNTGTMEFTGKRTPPEEKEKTRSVEAKSDAESAESGEQ